MADNPSTQALKKPLTSRAHTKPKAPGKAEGPVDKVLACRYEMKYVVTESQAAAMAPFIVQYIPVDRYCKLQRGGIYPIVSLYLDNADWRLCRESITGVKNRFKLRIRSYTDEPDYPRFFEIKRRINTVIMKSRARVMDRDIEPLLGGLPLPPQDYKTDEKALSQFQLYMKSINAGPGVLIRYWRQAWEGEGDNRVRVTFDRDLCYCITREPVVRLGGGGWQRNNMTKGHVILEIKFTGKYPAWLSHMAKCFNLRLRSMSKYATSVRQASNEKWCGPTIPDWEDDG